MSSGFKQLITTILLMIAGFTVFIKLEYYYTPPDMLRILIGFCVGITAFRIADKIHGRIDNNKTNK